MKCNTNLGKWIWLSGGGTGTHKTIQLLNKSWKLHPNKIWRANETNVSIPTARIGLAATGAHNIQICLKRTEFHDETRITTRKKHKQRNRLDCCVANLTALNQFFCMPDSAEILSRNHMNQLSAGSMYEQAIFPTCSELIKNKKDNNNNDPQCLQCCSPPLRTPASFRFR